jgi:hypothetical protein
MGRAISAEGRRLRRSLLAAAGLAVVHTALAYGLDALGLLSRLLAPASHWEVVLALAAGALFYGVRLVLLFVMPGLVLSALLSWAMRAASR